jgi:hypothetical protein
MTIAYLLPSIITEQLFTTGPRRATIVAILRRIRQPARASLEQSGEGVGMNYTLAGQVK